MDHRLIRCGDVFVVSMLKKISRSIARKFPMRVCCLCGCRYFNAHAQHFLLSRDLNLEVKRSTTTRSKGTSLGMFDVSPISVIIANIGLTCLVGMMCIDVGVQHSIDY